MGTLRWWPLELLLLSLFLKNQKRNKILWHLKDKVDKQTLFTQILYLYIEYIKKMKLQILLLTLIIFAFQVKAKEIEVNYFYYWNSLNCNFWFRDKMLKWSMLKIWKLVKLVQARLANTKITYPELVFSVLLCAKNITCCGLPVVMNNINAIVATEFWTKLK